MKSLSPTTHPFDRLDEIHRKRVQWFQSLPPADRQRAREMLQDAEDRRRALGRHYCPAHGNRHLDTVQ